MKLAVVLVRNLAARWLGAYGNEWVATPHLDRLAADGIVFEHHIADRTDGQSESYAAPVVRFDDLVPPWAVPADLFDTYAEDSEGLAPVREPAPIAPDDLAAWDALHFSYAAVLTRLDAKLGRFFDECRANGTAVLLTSDRGFPLGEHGIVGPTGSPAHAELVHLPLILRFPGGTGAGERVDGFTQPAALVRALGRTNLISDEDEKNLSEESEMLATVRSILAPVARTRDADGALRALRTAEWTALVKPATNDNEVICDHLYRRPEDPHEANDLAGRHPEIGDDLIRQFGRDDDYSSTTD